MLENNPAGLNRADIIVTANRGKEKSRLPLKNRWQLLQLRKERSLRWRLQEREEK